MEQLTWMSDDGREEAPNEVMKVTGEQKVALVQLMAKAIGAVYLAAQKNSKTRTPHVVEPADDHC